MEHMYIIQTWEDADAHGLRVYKDQATAQKVADDLNTTHGLGWAWTQPLVLVTCTEVCLTRNCPHHKGA